MIIELKRKFRQPSYTIGKLYINGGFVCDTLEDTDRGLYSYMSKEDILKRKVTGSTCIPYGFYMIDMDTISSRLSKSAFYIKECGGRVPRILNVKGFDGILIHAGNTDKDTLGCILVGENKVKGKVINSRDCFTRLYKILKSYHDRHEELYIKITEV